MRLPQKERQDDEGLGRLCGGFSTKVHAVCDALENPLDFIVTAGQKHDTPQLLLLVRNMPAQALLADKGNDSDDI